MYEKYPVISRMIRAIYRPIIPFWFKLKRWVVENGFLLWLNNQKVGKPSKLALPFVYIHKFFNYFMKPIWIMESSDYSLKKYHSLIKDHYSNEGRGYKGWETLSDSECIENFNNFNGRVAHYISHNSALLCYLDGDSFLDAGCGPGQNIKELVALFPKSNIHGFDINESALNVVRCALKENDRILIERKDISELETMQSFEDESFDHVLLSHVFGFLIGSGIEDTRKFRQNLIDNLVRISRKTVLIMDGGLLPDSVGPRVQIDQNTRCIYQESIIPYISKHKDGEAYVMIGPEDQALLYIKKS